MERKRLLSRGGGWLATGITRQRPQPNVHKRFHLLGWSRFLLAGKVYSRPSTNVGHLVIVDLRKISGRCLLHQLGGGFFVSATLERMKIEIDQSGKIEDTNRDTVIAYANGQLRSVRITSKTKRRLQEVYRRIGQPRVFVINTFCAGLALLLKKELKRDDVVIIDEEYSGYEQLIEELLRKMLGEHHDPNISFKRVGKSSPAHRLAVKVFRSIADADETLTFERLCKESFRIENGRPTLKYHLPFG